MKSKAAFVGAMVSINVCLLFFHSSFEDFSFMATNILAIYLVSRT